MKELAFRCFLALIGLSSLNMVLDAASIISDSNTASAWAHGGAIGLAVSGLYALLKSLGKF